MRFSAIATSALLYAFASTSLAKNVVVKNNCGQTVSVASNQQGPSALGPGQSKTYSLPDNWSGRFWGRENCGSYGCPPESAANPASLAEFTFGGYGGNDFYDVSFVDGWNLPISVSPIGGQGDGSKYRCGSPTCNPLPGCPSGFAVYSNGAYVGCQSACSHFNAPQYCCTGANNTPQTCSPSQYSQQVKSACPDVYSYAFDDKTSTYTCNAQGYTITFCP
ncbi:hypothetical protein EC973_001795 [Apophysomyces ossiformis]|uniref:Thaumatin-like protein n=1 Tax=Apophysomyces ossiformis TaxID=679940 RepID=A0A8H7EP33_9FUNG|nr:hypothetical protein EC973_001795 [Apophysomyces ossiformis]